MNQDVLKFWFKELKPKDWFAENKVLDERIKSRFGNLLKSAARAELYSWRKTAKGRLAEIIVLDQFSRNVYRNTPNAFAQDSQALTLAEEAVAAGADKKLTVDEKVFLYMPFMHSESRLIHQQAIKLFSQPGLEESYDFELRHKAIIDRFGRYPHRNKILGRKSSTEEIEFLKQPGSGF